MSLSSIFRSPRIARFSPAALLPWASGFASELRTVRLDRNAPLLVPLGAIVVLTFALLLQMLLPGPELESVSRTPRILPAQSPVLVTDYPAILAAPVFAPDRRSEAPVEKVSGSGEMTLLALARTGSEATALIAGSDGEIVRIGLGGAVEGWTLVSAVHDTVVLARDGVQRTLTIVPGESVPVEAPQAAAEPAPTAGEEDEEE